MSSLSNKNDDGVSPLYRQGGSLSKVGYFKAAHLQISSGDLFRDFFEAYWHAIPSGMRVKRVKDGHIDGVGQLRSRHRLFDNSSKGDHDWTKETLEISEEWESDYSPELHVALGIPSKYREWR
ncbi:hypothetical protein PS1_007879 [Malus domestica]